ncbi:hypothetical protein K438DRAFT_1764315 [Mycena galopus ATCC 62051]|nr:hypothetical protein K438DRAFT_1764315 [Mycena galopus ATCC 62051]
MSWSPSLVSLLFSEAQLSSSLLTIFLALSNRNAHFTRRLRLASSGLNSASSHLMGLYIFAAALVALLVLNLKAGRHARDLPPGPGKFCSQKHAEGSRNQVPAQKPWRWFQQFNDQYGPVVDLQMGRTPTEVIGTAQAAWNIQEKGPRHKLSSPVYYGAFVVFSTPGSLKTCRVKIF